MVAIKNHEIAYASNFEINTQFFFFFFKEKVWGYFFMILVLFRQSVDSWGMIEQRHGSKYWLSLIQLVGLRRVVSTLAHFALSPIPNTISGILSQDLVKLNWLSQDTKLTWANHSSYWNFFWVKLKTKIFSSKS